MLAVAAATVAAFLISTVWYSVFGASTDETTPPWKIAVELLRCLTLALVLAGLASRADIDTLAGGLVLGLVLWVGFPLVLWVGAMVWERTPWRLAAIHGGDWLVKLLALTAIVSVWS